LGSGRSGSIDKSPSPGKEHEIKRDKSKGQGEKVWDKFLADEAKDESLKVGVPTFKAYRYDRTQFIQCFKGFPDGSSWMLPSSSLGIEWGSLDCGGHHCVLDRWGSLAGLRDPFWRSHRGQ
jgi:hypothetical protein